MRTMISTKSLRLVLAAGLVGMLPVLGVHAAGQDVEGLYAKLQEQGGSAEDILVGLIENGIQLDSATEYTVSNAESIGLSIAYAQAAVCLAPDQPTAQSVGQLAADIAGDVARNAVQAGVVVALSSYAKGECRQLLDELNSGTQAFAAPTSGGDAGGSAGGGTPSLDSGDNPVSESQ